MKPFRDKFVCPKCDDVAFTVKFRPLVTVKSISGKTSHAYPEHLEYKCASCGFVECRTPKDYVQSDSGDK